MNDVKDLPDLIKRLQIMAKYNRRPDQKQDEITLLTATKVIEEMASTGWNVFSEINQPKFTGDYLCMVAIPADHGKCSTRMQVLHWHGDRYGWNCQEMIVTHWRIRPPEPLGRWVFHSNKEENDAD